MILFTSLGILLMLTICLIVFFCYTVYAFMSGAPFVPTSRDVIAKILRLDIIKKDNIVMDLGSGDGRVAQAIAPHCRISIAVEINPVLHYIARIRSIFVWEKNMLCYQRNLWEADIKNIDVLIVYFIPSKMKHLQQKILSEMKSGSTVISNTFVFPDWSYVKKDDTVYIYTVS